MINIDAKRLISSLIVGFLLGLYVTLKYIRQGMDSWDFLFLLGELFVVLVVVNLLLLGLLRVLDMFEDRKDP